ncbi:hypothetical protein DYI20_01825 [Auritidibacter ignavus]|nr:hypothetical protein DYI20_01825 [Auritidibacter ignavus]
MIPELSLCLPMSATGSLSNKLPYSLNALAYWNAYVFHVFAVADIDNPRPIALGVTPTGLSSVQEESKVLREHFSVALRHLVE